MARSSSSAGNSVLEMTHVAKAFGGVHALVDAGLILYPGEVHALLGENGAGKSTLLKTLAGVHRADAGVITLRGQDFLQGSTRDSIDQGIAVIYQEPSLFPDLSLAENVFVGRQIVSNGLVNWAAMEKASQGLFERLGVSLDPHAKARGISIADQQIVEIAKALSTDAKIIVMDEPTAALSSQEVDRLFTVVRNLRDQGSAVVFVSHRLDEVFALCDRMTVMRDGSTVGTSLISETSDSEVVRMMVGREVSELFPKLEPHIGDVVLQVKGMSLEGQFSDISFDVHAGEIFALAGLVGSGRSEVIRAIFGIDRYDEGVVTINGTKLPPGKPAVSMDNGIALVPEDRRQQGLFMASSIARNVAVTMLKKLSSWLLLRRKNEESTAAQWATTLQLKFAAIGDPVERLSGGNQQKVVLSKWLATEPKVLIVDEPTRGIDVGTKAEVHKLLSQKAQQGMAVIMVSSELPEVMGMADRIFVMREGEHRGTLTRAEASPEKIITLATGGVIAA
ncbi:MAG: sugar ABC transporter ATP-binding protein [Microbacteriaceae bacterium]|nr:sugar ABC transporter ATP-binding protein [Microbacteriaceae bacterium]MBT5730706.1 sugar ABC transporter ATP-binding protein [Microbacteriaceae bacterium]